MVYGVKFDLTHKARRVYDGSRVDPDDCQPGPQYSKDCQSTYWIWLLAPNI